MSLNQAINKINKEKFKIFVMGYICGLFFVGISYILIGIIGGLIWGF